MNLDQVAKMYYKHSGLTSLIYSEDWEKFTVSDMYLLLHNAPSAWTPVGEKLILDEIVKRKSSLLKTWTEA
jgi:hypothetical protein